MFSEPFLVILTTLFVLGHSLKIIPGFSMRERRGQATYEPITLSPWKRPFDRAAILDSKGEESVRWSRTSVTYANKKPFVLFRENDPVKNLKIPNNALWNWRLDDEPMRLRSENIQLALELKKATEAIAYRSEIIIHRQPSDEGTELSLSASFLASCR